MWWCDTSFTRSVLMSIIGNKASLNWLFFCFMIGGEPAFQKCDKLCRTKVMTGDLYLYLWSVTYFMKGGLKAYFSKVWRTLENRWCQKSWLALNIERGETHSLNVWQTLESKVDDGWMMPKKRGTNAFPPDWAPSSPRQPALGEPVDL